MLFHPQTSSHLYLLSQLFVTHFLSLMLGDEVAVWLGIRRFQTTQNFQYVPNKVRKKRTNIEYKYFKEGKPSRDTTKNCLVIDVQPDSTKWEDEICLPAVATLQKKYYTLCQTVT